jgi:hypothetical protein
MIGDVVQLAPVGIRLVPAGVDWDAVQVGRFLALQAVERITRLGAVAVDSVPDEPVLYFLVPAGTATRWDVPMTAVLGPSSHMVLPPDTKHTPPGPYWLSPPSCGLTPAAVLRLALRQALRRSDDLAATATRSVGKSIEVGTRGTRLG